MADGVWLAKRRLFDLGTTAKAGRGIEWCNRNIGCLVKGWLGLEVVLCLVLAGTEADLEGTANALLAGFLKVLNQRRRAGDVRVVR